MVFCSDLFLLIAWLLQPTGEPGSYLALIEGIYRVAGAVSRHDAGASTGPTGKCLLRLSFHSCGLQVGE